MDVTIRLIQASGDVMSEWWPNKPHALVCAARFDKEGHWVVRVDRTLNGRAFRRCAGRAGEAACRSQTDRRDALAGGQIGLDVMRLGGDAVQDISWPGLQAPVEAYNKEGFEGGRHSLPHRGHETAEWRRF